MELQGIIQPQRFEQVRDRIGYILATEIPNQVALMAAASPPQDGTAYNASVWVARVFPFDKSELPAINVTLLEGDYEDADLTSSDGTYVFAVDIYTHAKSSDDADNLAAVKRDKITGWCRAILKHPGYKTLGYTAPMLCRTTVRKLIVGAGDRDDALSTSLARLEVVVKVPEVVELKTGVQAVPGTTTVTLHETDRGYQYIGGMAARYVIDSGYLPAGEIQVGWIQFGDEDAIVIGNEYANINAAIAYLNSNEFKTANNKTGTFILHSGKYIWYTNPENYSTIEIMAIYKNETKVFALGNAPALNVEVIAIDNTDTIVHSSLLNKAVAAVHVGNVPNEPLQAGGWNFDPTTGSLSLGATYQDINVYILINQVPA